MVIQNGDNTLRSRELAFPFELNDSFDLVPEARSAALLGLGGLALLLRRRP